MAEYRFEVVGERRNPYLDRVEYVVRVEHTGMPTPSRDVIAKYVVERLGLDPGKTVLMSIRTLTGMNVSEILIYYYPNGIDMSTLEPPDRGKVLGGGEEES